MLVLAAGEATRFAGRRHKLDAELGGRSLLARAVDAAVASGVGPVGVVVAADPPRRLRTVIPAGVTAITSERWRLGSAASLHAGLEWAAGLGADGVVIALGDQPFLTSDAWRAVAATEAPVAVATYDGVRGHPVLLTAAVWPMLPTSGDEGARALMRLRPDLVREVPCRGSAVDIDTVEDLRRWQNNSSTSSP